MDQELIAYLDKRFRETAEQISDQIGSLRQDTTRQIAGLEGKITGLEGQIAGLEGQITGLREETTQRFEQVERRFEQVDRRFEQAEERDRQILVVTEGIRHEVHLVAEAYLGINDILKSFQSEKVTFEHFTLWMAPYFRNLDRRVEALENRRDREHMDVMDAVRDSLNKPPFKPAVPTD